MRATSPVQRRRPFRFARALVALWLALPWCGLPTAAASEPAADLTQAIAHYQRAQQEASAARRAEAFARAASSFEQAALHYTARGERYAQVQANAGTAYLQAGRPGKAVLAFKRALKASPRHQRALLTLAELRSTLPGWVPRPDDGASDSFFAWHVRYTLAERAGAMLLAFITLAMLAAASIALRAGWLLWAAALPGIVFAAAAISVLDGIVHEAPQEAVISRADTIARVADSANAPPRFAEPLPQGTEVSILETRGYWLRVGLADGSPAWVRKAAVTPVEDRAAG